MTRKMKPLLTQRRLLIGIVCVLLIIGSSTVLLFLHNAVGQRGVQQGSKTATTHSTPKATDTPTPTSTATEVGIAPTPAPLFVDNFSNNSLGWYVNNKGGYIRAFSAAGLTLSDTNHNPLIESLPTTHKFDDFILTTTLTFKQGDANDSVGLYLRGDSNLDHDYRIDIFGNTTYAISKEYLDANNMPQTLYIVPPTHTTALKARGTANTLTVIMKGATLFLLMNEKLVNAIIDEDYTRGQVALFVTNGATSTGVSAVFSSIEIDAAPSNQYPVIGGCPTPTPEAMGTTTTTATTIPTPEATGTATPMVCK